MPAMSDKPNIIDDDELDLNDKQQVFLEAIRAGMDYSEASAHAGVNRSTSYRWRLDPSFAERVKQAEQVSVDQLKQEAHRRAMRGSDRLLEFLLINRAPDEFQNVRNVNVSGHLATANMTDEEIVQELAQLRAQGIVLPSGVDEDSDVDDLL